ncbi:MAG: NAD(P)-dependent alcohol dehydrogenase [Candidatus Beckwithbacteria bacterium]|nr:NAD(P)-dependent alcohol dehydrogenase [Patescibacteria group bacterium]
MKIKAFASYKPKEKLKEYVYEKKLRQHDVLIKIKYASIARGDICFIDDFWNSTKYPYIPSSEAFGIIEKLGTKVKDFKVGDYVGFGYQSSACFKCKHCKEGKEQFCQKQKVLGIDDNGALAEHIIFDSRLVHKIPKQLQKPQYVPLMCSGLTVFSAIKHYQIKPKMKVGVIGVGNLGHLAIQILNKMNCEVTAFSHSTSKKADLEKLGVKLFISSINKKQLEKEKGKYDFIISTSSGPLDWSLFIEALKAEGTLCFVGLPEKAISFPAILLADYTRKRVVGSYIGSSHDMEHLINFAEKHKITALVETFPKEKANEAIQLRRQKKTTYSVVINLMEK